MSGLLLKGNKAVIETGIILFIFYRWWNEHKNRNSPVVNSLIPTVNEQLCLFRLYSFIQPTSFCLMSIWGRLNLKFWLLFLLWKSKVLRSISKTKDSIVIDSVWLCFFLIKTGNQFWAIRGNEMQAGYPRGIHTLGLPSTVKKIDSAFSDKEKKKTYFFAEDKYWR